MRILTFSLVLLLSCHWINTPKAKNGHPKLELLSVHQLEKNDTLNFDFSGITQVGNSIYAVADKPWNTYLYSIMFTENSWSVDSARKILSSERLDLEAIDHCDGNFYLANEFTGSINLLQSKSDNLVQLSINFEDYQLKPETWKNAGWEGLTIDCENQVMYLVKERQPRNIIRVDMKNWQILEQFDIPQHDSNDFSDVKFQNGFLYLLERNGNFVTKVDIKQKKVLQKYHYKHIASHPNGKLYAREKYGMAEALLLLNDEIWIGLDNNGHEVSDHAIKTYQMRGNSPVILKFKRPKDF
ncbi:MAG: SdiA-regulated domain-containing protein [Reichenbachiella sp.]|uniref:SdiA-regulated domain-containing protein n=1 Tax=Reichenbachiella sp. TaxID=2184521 RepID=UPI00329A4711